MNPVAGGRFLYYSVKNIHAEKHFGSKPLSGYSFI